ncbi:hypothetical protein LIER_44151 [Lithospermum erythrorhizon]|uniref:Reverse transcriptase zinc-binding domain-containing protein n=1 Tax=Lithospermum erythrorhizon TaxID=34254 RepID=A0AAV3QM15_LITER
MGKLDTKDRISKWNADCDLKCMFCNANETQNHLFFECEFSGKIWRRLLCMLNMYRQHKPWDWQKNWLLEVRTCCRVQKLLKLRGCVVVYWIWRERNERHTTHSMKIYRLMTTPTSRAYDSRRVVTRNERVFGSKRRDEECIIQLVVSQVCDKMNSLRGIKRSCKDWEMAVIWGLSSKIFA